MYMLNYESCVYVDRNSVFQKLHLNGACMLF